MDPLIPWPIVISPLVVFGVLLLFGSIGGYVAHRVSWIPSITGFMGMGLLIGPSGLGLLTEESIKNSTVLIDIALALILYRLGLSLDLAVIKDRPLILLSSLLECTAVFFSVLFTLYFFELPLTVSALIAAITISSSPAVLLHVAHEVKAEGIVTETTKSLVALNNIISFVVFSTVLPLLYHAEGADTATMLLLPPIGFVALRFWGF